MNTSVLLERNARKFKDKTALFFMGHEMTYQTLNERVNQCANALKGKGVQQGDKVILFLPNVPEFAISLLAVHRLGAVAAPVNARLTASELSYIIEHSEATTFITHELLFEAARNLPEEHSDLTYIKTGDPTSRFEAFDQVVASASPEAVPCDLGDDELATLLYTSGTTGKPKGVLFSYRNIMAVATMMAVETEMKPESRMLHMMPLSHSAPLHLFFVAGLYVGASHVLHPTFTPDDLLTVTENTRPTHFFGAPVAYLLTAQSEKLPQTDLSSVKWWIYGGAPLSAAEVGMIQNAFNTDRLMCVYGLTEAGPSGTLLAPHEHGQKSGSIGCRAALNTEIELLDEHGEPAAAGEVGEIALRGEGNMVGYFKDEEKTRTTYQGDWLLTGDMARKDEDGYYWVVDRKKDMIISGGVNVYPKEIEDVLKIHPDIQDAAIIGVPHPEWGESIKAFVVAKETLDAPQALIRTFLEDKIAAYKIPHLAEQVADLPRNPTGKILKQELRNKEENVS
ncbi:class I adenylate-forming enzyme family protein [Salsuginibacillus kocurii]|uniref:class I adenylate-forming enzyme family protein n=1 Tax=Salsuginibacillus kocurii TaxID=427078 RepID=UPI00036527A1|nr:AMP-binding protein [Salsuginibacillus kocurii]